MTDPRTMDDPSDTTLDPDAIWLILVNAQQQYSVWPALRPVPEGWQETGPEGSRAACLEWVDAHWTDMRPASIR